MLLREAWEVLGLPNGAPEAEALLRFRTLLKEWHPDRHRETGLAKEAHARTVALTTARSVLADNGWTKPPPRRPGAASSADTWSTSASSSGGRRTTHAEPGARPQAGTTRRGAAGHPSMSPAGRKAFNRALAAAMRTRKVQPAGDAWQQAKADPLLWGVDPRSYA